MFECRNMKFSDMKNKSVIDKTGNKIGRLIDFHFDFTKGDLQLKSVVIGGGRIEEFLESIGVRPDIDPFFDMKSIEKYEDDTLYLNVEYQKLGEPVKLGDKEMKLSDLSKIKIMDSTGLKVGNVKDVWFDENCRMWFIVGGGFFEEFLESIRIKADIDFLVPQESITSISPENLHLKVNKFQLETTAKEEFEKYKDSVKEKLEPGDTRHVMLKLGVAPRSDII